MHSIGSIWRPNNDRFFFPSRPLTYSTLFQLRLLPSLRNMATTLSSAKWIFYFHFIIMSWTRCRELKTICDTFKQITLLKYNVNIINCKYIMVYRQSDVFGRFLIWFHDFWPLTIHDVIVYGGTTYHAQSHTKYLFLGSLQPTFWTFNLHWFHELWYLTFIVTM